MKKLIAFIIALILLLILLIVVILDADFGKNKCEPTSSSGSSAPAVINGDFAYPTDPEATSLTSPFGPRWGTLHDGIDLAGPVGTPLYAFADGRVLDARDTGVDGFGGWVVIEHNIDGRQIQTVYGHQDPGSNHVQAGDLVTKGQHIADMGNSGFSTGPHLHFEIVEGDRAAGGQKVDPWPWIEPVLNAERHEQRDESDEHETPTRGTTPAEIQGVAGLNGRQTALAKQIVAIGEALGVDKKGRVIAVATAKHESQLKVYANDGVILPHELTGMPPGMTSEELRKSLEYPHDAVGTDHASVGTFQQQVGFWGSVEELMNPAVNAKKFYERLVEIDYHSMEIGVAASTVQGNATGTGVYQAEASIAEQLVDTFAGSGEELSAEEIEALGTSSIGSSSLSDCNTIGGSASNGGSATGSASGTAIVNAARKQSGLPYVWGGGDINGATGGGFDCSGLVLYAVYQASGGTITLPHQSAMQRQDPHVQEVEWEERQPGDIIFVGTPGDEHHVAIYSGKNSEGQDMWIEAQTYGVPVGEYPVRFDAPLSVGRVVK